MAAPLDVRTKTRALLVRTDRASGLTHTSPFVDSSTGRESRSIERGLVVAQEAARAASVVLARHRAGALVIEEKLGGEIVTAADVEADSVIRHMLGEAFPDDGLYTEETPDDGARHARRRVWIVDPIDATGDFVRGGNEHAVSIGLAVDGIAVLGVVYNPATDELVCGGLGVGVTLNGAEVRTTATFAVAGARIACSRKELDRGLDRVSSHIAVTPVASMAYKLARVAAGLDDGAISEKARGEWGSCAGVALARAAGGVVTYLDGKAPRFNRIPGERPLGLIAAGPTLRPRLLEAFIAAR